MGTQHENYYEDPTKCSFVHCYEIMLNDYMDHVEYLSFVEACNDVNKDTGKIAPLENYLENEFDIVAHTE